MNRLLITIVTILTLAATGIALAQDTGAGPGYGKKGQQQQRGHQLMPFGQDLMRGLKRLDLSEEQKTAVKAVFEGLKEELHPVMVEMRDGQKQIRELVRAESYDEAAVAVLAEREGELAAFRIMLTSQAMADVRAQLTDEQLEQFDAMAGKARARHAKQRGRKGNRGGNGGPPPTEG